MLFILLVNLVPLLGIQLKLPSSDFITISLGLLVSLIVSPLITVSSLIINYRDIIEFDKKNLDEILKPLPRETRINIVENLKALNIKIKDQLNIE